MKRILINKPKFNLSIDIILLLLMMAIAGIGLLMKYVLIAGFERNALYGNHVDLLFGGLTRHQWGTIHFIISITFFGLLILHIIFHWNMIVCTLRRMVPHKTLRIALTGVFTIIFLLLISFPLLVEPEIIEKGPLHRGRNNRNINSTSECSDSNKQLNSANTAVLDSNTKDFNKKNQHLANEEYEVYGYQTLQFVADKYNVPASTIAADLKIPVTLATEKLGRLRKQYSFTMDDVKNSISNYKKSLK